MSLVSKSNPAPQRARKVFVWVRRGVILYAIGAVLYLSWRFDLKTLPRKGVTPLLEYRPGTRLLIDQRGRAVQTGDALLFRDAQDRCLLARLGEKPVTELRPGLWLLADNHDYTQGYHRRTDHTSDSTHEGVHVAGSVLL